MFKNLVALVIITGLGFGTAQAESQKKEKSMDNAKLYNFSLKDIDGKERSLAEFKGKALLLVNVASKCGNTPQYKALEELYTKYKEKGFAVLGFPCNDFFSQEPGDEKQIKQFCTLTYGVNFPMFSKIKVKGKEKAPLYKYLTEESPFKGDIEWNFAKFLADKHGNIVARFSPKTKPDSAEVVQAIEKVLQ